MPTLEFSPLSLLCKTHVKRIGADCLAIVIIEPVIVALHGSLGLCLGVAVHQHAARGLICCAIIAVYLWWMMFAGHCLVMESFRLQLFKTYVN